MEQLGHKTERFEFKISESYYKGQGESAAAELRKHFQYAPHAVRANVYEDFRRLGFHVFRRSLSNSKISGLTIQHPSAGTCILVNYSEDIYRQRFTAAHEAAHGILDRGDDVIVSFSDRDRDMIEIRANRFASCYLLPPELVRQIPVREWDQDEAVRYAAKFKVSTAALAVALQELGVVKPETAKDLRNGRVPAEQKVDPELAELTGRSLDRKRDLLRRGLTHSYVNLCFNGLSQGIITTGRAAEMLLVEDIGLGEIGELFGLRGGESPA